MKVKIRKVNNIGIREKYSIGWFGWCVDISVRYEIKYHSITAKGIHLLKRLQGLQKTLASKGIEVNFADKFGHYTHIGQIERVGFSHQL